MNESQQLLATAIACDPDPVPAIVNLGGRFAIVPLGGMKFSHDRLAPRRVGRSGKRIRRYPALRDSAPRSGVRL